jgi:hypothetical protein
MALAILLGGFVGLLVAGGVLVVGTIRHARREEDEINRAFAEVRGTAHHHADDSPTWSSIDMEALREEGYDFDHSDPYAPLTGEISWSESTLADGHAPMADAVPEPVVVAEPAEEVAEPFTIAEPITIAEPAEEVAEPFTIAEPITIAEPAEEVAEPFTIAEPITIAEPVRVAEPIAVPEPVTVAQPAAARAAPAPVREDGPVVWRAPAQSQVIILAVSLRALADAVAATVTQEAWERFDDAYAQVRSRFQGGDAAHKSPSVDVRGRQRRWSNGPTDGWAPRRNGPSRRGGPKHISWRAR